MSCRGWFCIASALAPSVACAPRTVAAESPDATPAHAAALVRAEGTATELYRGTARAPIAGLWLGPRPVAFFHDPEGAVPESDSRKRLADEESLVLSSDWTRHLIVRHASKEPFFDFYESPVSVPGLTGFALATTGALNVVWTLPDEDAREAEVRILDAAWKELGTPTSIEGLAWVHVSASGERAVLGGARETLLLDRRGEVRARLAHAEHGKLSPDGAWLALEQTENGRRLALVRDGREPVSFEVKDEAIALAFDARSSRLARITPARLEVYRLDGERPVRESDGREPPPGFRWRSAAYSAEGRLAAGRIRIVHRPERRPATPPEPDTPGEAWLGVDWFGPDSRPNASASWPVTDWNLRAPELAFGAHETLYALAWPSAFEVKP